MKQSVSGLYPEIPSSAYVHPSAVVIGDVVLGKSASVWPNAVLRGDMRRITVGEMTSVQDGCVLHTGKYELVIGAQVLIGHGALLHSCEIGDQCLIGMGAIVMDAAKIGSRCVVAAGTVVPGGKVVEPGSLVMGNPCRVVRKTTDEDIEYITENCAAYAELAKGYKRTGNIL